MNIAFGTVLKEWRNQRRMSQLDLGLNANVSARHISFLETGRASPSREMVLRLCEELEVPRQTRNQFLAAAGLSAAYKTRDLSEADMVPVRAAVDWILERHAPFPAIAMDRHWKVAALNQPAQLLLAGMGVQTGDSLLSALAENMAVRGAIENLDEVIQHTVARLRTETAYLGGDPVLDAAIETLTEGYKGTSSQTNGVLPAFIPARYCAGGQVFSFFSTFTQFGTVEDIALSELKIEMMFPADEETRQLLLAMG